MTSKDKKDFQTLSIFAILALLTILFVSGLRLVLFAPTAPVPTPVLELPAQK